MEAVPWVELYQRREAVEACRFGAFVDDIELFDAGFFRISPVEAQLLDPQQRMMLETSWQAFDDAGINPDGLKESLTGVYTGISNDEYRMLVVDSTKPSGAAECLYALSGTNLNGTSGRVSFVLGLMGPAKAVDGDTVIVLRRHGNPAGPRGVCPVAAGSAWRRPAGETST